MKLQFPHPGLLLRQEFLDPMHITAYRLAKSIGVPQTRIAGILACKRAITADTGLRLDKYFNMTPGYWLGLQTDYDLRIARKAIQSQLDLIRPVVATGITHE